MVAGGGFARSSVSSLRTAWPCGRTLQGLGTVWALSAMTLPRPVKLAASRPAPGGIGGPNGWIPFQARDTGGRTR
jgi:hypothetical protein